MNSNKTYHYFVIFIAGGIFSMLLTQSYLINPHIHENAMMVKGLLRDMNDVEKTVIASYGSRTLPTYRRISSDDLAICNTGTEQMIAKAEDFNRVYSAKSTTSTIEE